MINPLQVSNNFETNSPWWRLSDAALPTIAQATTSALAQPTAGSNLNRPAQFGTEWQPRWQTELNCARAISDQTPSQTLSDARPVQARLFDASLTAAPVKKKRRGFFSKLGGALKKFARSKFGKILMIGGAVAGSLLIPGVGAAAVKAFSALGKNLLGGVSKLATKLGASHLFKGGFKTFLRQEVFSKLGIDGGIKQAAQNYLKQKFLNIDSLKEIGRGLLKRFGLQDILSQGGLKAVLSQLGARLGISDEWLEKLFGEPRADATPQSY